MVSLRLASAPLRGLQRGRGKLRKDLIDPPNPLYLPLFSAANAGRYRSELTRDRSALGRPLREETLIALRFPAARKFLDRVGSKPSCSATIYGGVDVTAKRSFQLREVIRWSQEGPRMNAGGVTRIFIGPRRPDSSKRSTRWGKGRWSDLGPRWGYERMTFAYLP